MPAHPTNFSTYADAFNNLLEMSISMQVENNMLVRHQSKPVELKHENEDSVKVAYEALQRGFRSTLAQMVECFYHDNFIITKDNELFIRQVIAHFCYENAVESGAVLHKQIKNRNKSFISNCLIESGADVHITTPVSTVYAKAINTLHLAAYYNVAPDTMKLLFAKGAHDILDNYYTYGTAISFCDVKTLSVFFENSQHLAVSSCLRTWDLAEAEAIKAATAATHKIIYIINNIGLGLAFKDNKNILRTKLKALCAMRIVEKQNTSVVYTYTVKDQLDFKLYLENAIAEAKTIDDCFSIYDLHADGKCINEHQSFSFRSKTATRILLDKLTEEKLLTLFNTPNYIKSKYPVNFYLSLEKYKFSKELLLRAEKEITLNALWNERNNPAVADYIKLQEIIFPQQTADFFVNVETVRNDLRHEQKHQYDNVQPLKTPVIPAVNSVSLISTTNVFFKSAQSNSSAQEEVKSLPPILPTPGGEMELQDVSSWKSVAKLGSSRI